MFSSFANPFTGDATANERSEPEKHTPPNRPRTYNEALISYLERHPSTTEEDIEIIKKEGGDLECLFLWGASEQDIADAEIIARGPTNPSSNHPNRNPLSPTNPNNNSGPGNSSSGRPPETAGETPSSPQAKQPPPKFVIPNENSNNGNPNPNNNDNGNNNPNNNGNGNNDSSNNNTNNNSNNRSASGAGTSSAPPLVPKAKFVIPPETAPATPVTVMDDAVQAPPKSSAASAGMPSAPSPAPCTSCAGLRNEVASLQQQLAAATAANIAASNAKCDKCASLTFQLAVAQQQSEDANKGKALSEFETERLRVRGLSDQQEIERLKRSLAAAEASAAQGKKDIDEIAALKKRVAELETAKVTADRSIADLTAAHAPCAAIRAASETEVALLKKRVAEADIQAKADAAEIARLKSQLADAQKDKGLAASIAAKDARLFELEGLLKKANDRAAAGDVETQRLQKLVADGTTDLAALRQELASLRKQMDDREKQSWRELGDLQRQLEDASASSVDADSLKRRVAELVKQRGADQATIEDLRRQLLLVGQQNEALGDKVTALTRQGKTDADTITQLRAQLAELTKRQVVDDEVDKKRIADLREVNDWLLRFARERAFQEDLARPLVKVALDCWGGDISKHSEAQLEAARFDEGVNRIYPRVKEFEKICDAARIRFPNDHIVAKKTQLSPEAVTYAFGPDFVAKHHIEGHYT